MLQSPSSSAARALLIGPLPPPTAGVEELTAALLADLRRSGWQVRHVDTQKHRLPVSRRGRLSLWTLAYAARDLGRFAWALLRHRPRVVHTPFASTLTGALRDSVVVLLARAARVPVVAHLHGGDFDRLLRTAPAPASRLIRRALCSSSRVIVLSEYWRRLLEASFSGLRCVVLPNGSADLAPESPAPPPAAPQPPSGRPLRVLHVGAQGRRKGVPELLQACAQLRAAGRDLRLILVGGEEWHGEAAHIDTWIRRLHLAPVVERIGHVEGPARFRHYHRADLFCLPSHHEGAPVALLEAMSAALPVVVTRVGAMPEMVLEGEGGHLVPPGEIAPLAAAIDALLQDPSRRAAMGSANRRRWEQHYRLEQHLSGVRSLLAEVIFEAAPLSPSRNPRAARSGATLSS
jgi:glycosyltransferase involved in cell wall biosynthesis